MVGADEFPAVIFEFANLEAEGGDFVEEEVGFGGVFVETGGGFLEAGGVFFGGGVFCVEEIFGFHIVM